jgi:hypothetical protein
MKERIRELAQQAGITLPADTEYNGHVHRNAIERFAQLIVKECVQTLRDNTPVLDENESVEDWNKGYIRAMLDCEHHITEHFGLE